MNEIVLLGSAKESYILLNHSTNNKELFSNLLRKVDLLRINCEVGFQIKKSLIPKYYIKKYQINNLWKINLNKGWRLIYSIHKKLGFIEILILDIFNHKDYEQKFGY